MKRILIVEDNRLERRLLVHILCSAYHKRIWIDEAADGESAITLLENKGPYDLIITDLIMPKMEGLELISKIKTKTPETQNILAISGGNPYYLTMAKKLGAFGIFTKPLDKERFLIFVESILNRTSLTKTILSN